MLSAWNRTSTSTYPHPVNAVTGFRVNVEKFRDESVVSFSSGIPVEDVSWVFEVHEHIAQVFQPTEFKTKDIRGEYTVFTYATWESLEKDRKAFASRLYDAALCSQLCWTL